METTSENAAYDSENGAIPGNESGQHILDSHNSIDQKLECMERKMERIKRENHELQQELGQESGQELGQESGQESGQELGQELGQDDSKLNSLSNDYLKARSRRIDIYIREVVGIATEASALATIDDGNGAAQDGNAAADIFLYKTEMRSDKYILVTLYGLTFDEIVILLENERFDTIGVIDAWSTREGNRHISPIPEEVNEAFDTFIWALRMNLRADPGDGNSSLGRAFAEFHLANNKRR